MMATNERPGASEAYAQRALTHATYLAGTIGGRGSCTRAEREAAEYAADEMRRMGAHPVAVEDFRGAASSYRRYAAALATALFGGLLAWTGPRRAKLPLAAVLHAVAASGMLAESDFSASWLRWLVRGRPSQNVLGRLAPGGRAPKKVVLTAHLDTHRTPVFNSTPAWQRAYNRMFRLLFASLPAGAVLYLLAGLTGWRWPVWLAILPDTALLTGLALFVHADETPFSPGAYDNASGVGSVLALGERLAVEPLAHTEVLLALLGCEETGAEGMAALLAAHGDEWRDALIVNLDQMGLGTLYVRTREGMLIRHRPQPGVLELAREIAAARPELQVFERPSQAFSDAVVAYKHGLAALSLGTTPHEGGPAVHRHQMSDTPDHLSLDALRATQVFVRALLEAIDTT